MASSSTCRCAYHVFLSFRGEDTRKNFTDHLYTALVQAGIHTFRDDDEIKRGENIEAEIQKAIQESKISIIVFSKDYASSRWCLDELVKIMERRTSVGHIAIPVFYDVDPSQVRKQTGSFAEAFTRHEERFKEEMDKVQGWREALRQVADLGGMVLQNGYESQFIQDIIKETGSKLNRTILNVAPFLVGIDKLVSDINLWLQDGSNSIGIAIISGIGGIGKTTIAKIAYNLNFDRFEGKSFLANFKETSAQFDGLIRLQKQLVSDLLSEKKIKINNVDQGIVKIKDAICCRRVFVVLDDVDDLDQLYAIIGMQEWFYPGSKIIITTRNEKLPIRTGHDSCKKFEVKELNYDDSLHLFSWHAFGQYNPIDGYMECSRNAVNYCGGLPLALRNLGSCLSGKSVNVWESVIQKLEAYPDGKIQKILRISYDSLEDDHDKSLFLDIACFFVGKKRDYVVTILEGCGFYTTIGIETLIDKCLLFVDTYNKLGMHQLLRDMGREIVRQESPEDPGKRSRLWHDKDGLNVLIEKAGTETVKGLTLDMHRVKGAKRGKSIANANHIKRYQYECSSDDHGNCSKRHRLDFFSWKPSYMISRNSFSSSNEVDLKTDTVAKMPKLKLLQLNYVKLSGGYEEFPKHLVWLCWQGFPLESIPKNLSLEKLVALDMRNSKLKQNWKGGKFLGELKILNLSHSYCLIRTPDFSGLPALERLILKDCINLISIDESIADLQSLIFLNLEGCKNLRKLSKEIVMLKSLEVLILSGCSRLDELPEELGNMESLQVLHADETAINQSNSTTRDIKKFNFLLGKLWYSILPSWVFSRTNTRSPSFSLASLPRSLVNLSLSKCNLSDNAIPSDISGLSSLQILSLGGNPIHGLPESTNSLSSLRFLDLEGCTELQSLPELPKSLINLASCHCTSLERVTNLPNFSSNLDFFFYGCHNLVEVEGLFKLEPVTNICIEMINNLGLFNLESVESIEIEMYNTFTCEKIKAPLQVLHECGIFNIFLPGSEVPSWYNHHSVESLISFDVAPPVGHNIHGLNLCIVYESQSGSDDVTYVTVRNKTKLTQWSYWPICYGKPGPNEEMLWLSHWKFGDQLEAGDHVEVLVKLKPFFKLKKWGINLAYEPDDHKDISPSNSKEIVESSSSWYQTLTLSDQYLSKYQQRKGEYILFNGWWAQYTNDKMEFLF